jgi:hypothetical protein
VFPAALWSYLFFFGETSCGAAIELRCVTHLYSSASIGFAPYLLPMGLMATRGSGGWQAGQTGGCLFMLNKESTVAVSDTTKLP